MGEKKVALLVETARGYGRQFLRGVINYSRLYGPWRFHIQAGDFFHTLPNMDGWKGDGIIARVVPQYMYKTLVDMQIPTIVLDLSYYLLKKKGGLERVHEVRSHSESAGRIAAQHLLERGHRRFAFIGLKSMIWSSLRQTSFCQAVEEAGFSCEVINFAANPKGGFLSLKLDHLAEWLKNLEKPVGILVCNDDRARVVLDACHLANIKVPEEIAVVGVDNDSLWCELCDPPLSSVEFNATQAGYDAAKLLDQMMKGEGPQEKKIIYAEAVQVAARRSSDFLAIDDREVAAALRWIWDHSGEVMQVDQIAREVGLARRTLELRFQKVLRRSIYSEIQRNHLERAKRFLMESDLTIPEIAANSGYGSASYMVHVFQRELKMTPSHFRLLHRGR